MKAAVYSGTRNVYKNMVTAMKSLLVNSNIEKIYFLIEDDTFPFSLPSNIECLNMKHQQWFPSNCPNLYPFWGGPMSLLRAALPKIFPQLDQILSLDNDTIVIDDITNLWNLDLTNYYLAGVRDVEYLCKGKFYMNTGVMMCNLKKLRMDHIDDKAISLLNRRQFDHPEQDVLNILCQGHIFELPSAYNNAESFMNYSPKNPKIIHYVGDKQYIHYPLPSAYKNITLEDIKNESSSLLRNEKLI